MVQASKIHRKGRRGRGQKRCQSPERRNEKYMTTVRPYWVFLCKRREVVVAKGEALARTERRARRRSERSTNSVQSRRQGMTLRGRSPSIPRTRFRCLRMRRWQRMRSRSARRGRGHRGVLEGVEDGRGTIGRAWILARKIRTVDQRSEE